MEERSPIRTLLVDISMVRDSPFFCCPRCGQPIVTSEAMRSCPHLWYTYDGNIDTFSYVSEELAEKFSWKAKGLAGRGDLQSARLLVREMCRDADTVAEFVIDASGPMGALHPVQVCIDFLKGQDD